jgi:hypothetical protein
VNNELGRNRLSSILKVPSDYLSDSKSAEHYTPRSLRCLACNEMGR